MPAFLPSTYIEDTDVRLNLYRRLSTLRENEDLEAVTEEIQDRFGPPPDEVRNLLGLMSVRVQLQQIGASRLEVGRQNLVLTFLHPQRIDAEGLLRVIENKPDRYQFLSPDKLRIRTGLLSPPGDLVKIQEAIQALRPSPGEGELERKADVRIN
jgi:transcription-repair coupling factor (superfamily II helicase)